MSFPRYDSYKDSGVEWLGDIPSHWIVGPIRHSLAHLFSGATAQQVDEGDETVPVTRIETISSGEIDPNRLGYVSHTDIAPSFRLAAGDILFSNINSLKMIGNCAQYAGGFELYAGMNLLTLRPHTSIHARWLLWCVKDSAFRCVVESLAKPAINQASVSQASLLGIHIARPTPEEQSAIASFLDRETAKIDALVDEQKRLIELLKEKRQSVISHAVTKGLDPNAPTKDSGIDWLGEVPAHWTISPLKHLASIKGRIGFRGYSADDLVNEGEGALTLGGANLLPNGFLSLEQRTYLSWEKYEESPEIKVELGDILLGQRGTCGRVAYFEDPIGPATINPSLVIIRSRYTRSKFLFYSLSSDLAQKTMDSFLSKTAIPMLSQAQIGGVLVCYPPSEEQKKIEEHLTAQLAQSDRLEAAALAAIYLLSERRSTLISAAITGKIDVRNLVAVEAEAA